MLEIKGKIEVLNRQVKIKYLVKWNKLIIPTKVIKIFLKHVCKQLNLIIYICIYIIIPYILYMVYIVYMVYIGIHNIYSIYIWYIYIYTIYIGIYGVCVCVCIYI